MKEPKIVVLGTVEESIDFYKSRNSWGPFTGTDPISVSRIIVVAVNKNWKRDAEKIPVHEKKEFFFRAILPMILYENSLILGDRARLKTLRETLSKGKLLKKEALTFLNKLCSVYGLSANKNAKGKNPLRDFKPLMAQLLNRVDIIPPSLAISQSACESGYGTSRFTQEGNALFGEWTFTGKGMKAKEHRKEKGDYRIRSFDWPYNSLRSYVNNLNTGHHYADFRAKRAKLRKENRPITGLALAGSLKAYSEKRTEYAKDIENLIKNNHLEQLDCARLRDDPLILVVYVDTQTDEALVKKEIEKLRASGELARDIRSMELKN